MGLIPGLRPGRQSRSPVSVASLWMFLGLSSLARLCTGPARAPYLRQALGKPQCGRPPSACAVHSSRAGLRRQGRAPGLRPPVSEVSQERTDTSVISQTKPDPRDIATRTMVDPLLRSQTTTGLNIKDRPYYVWAANTARPHPTPQQLVAPVRVARAHPMQQQVRRYHFPAPVRVLTLGDSKYGETSAVSAPVSELGGDDSGWVQVPLPLCAGHQDGSEHCGSRPPP